MISSPSSLKAASLVNGESHPVTLSATEPSARCVCEIAILSSSADATSAKADEASAILLLAAPALSVVPLPVVALAALVAARRETSPSSPVGTNDGPQSHPKSDAGLRTKLLRA